MENTTTLQVKLIHVCSSRSEFKPLWRFQLDYVGITFFVFFCIQVQCLCFCQAWLRSRCCTSSSSPTECSTTGAQTGLCLMLCVLAAMFSVHESIKFMLFFQL